MQFNQCNPPKKVQFIDSFIIELVSRKCKPDGVPARHCQRWNVFERSFFLKGHFFIDLDLKKKLHFGFCGQNSCAGWYNLVCVVGNHSKQEGLQGEIKQATTILAKIHGGD